MNRAWTVGLAMSVVVGSVATVRAEEERLVELSHGSIRVDGMLRDWRQVALRMLGEGNDGAMHYAFGYDREALYVAARVYDRDFVRTPRRGENEDAIVVTFANSRGEGWECWLHAGEIGHTEASAAVGRVGSRPRRTNEVQVVEGPTSDGVGYELEARIPWSVLQASGDWEQGHLAIRLRDVDSIARRRVREVASAPVQRNRLHELPSVRLSGGAHALWASFRRERDLLAVEPTFETRANVAEDETVEQVAVIDRFLFVAGLAFQRGERYAYAELPVRSGEQVLRVRTEPGDGGEPADIVITARLDHREVELVYRVSGPGGLLLTSRELRPAPESPRQERQEVEHRVASERETPEPARVAPRLRLDDVLARALAEAGLPRDQAARVVLDRNVVGDPTMECVALYDRFLVVVGPAFQEGTGYVYFELPVASGADVLSLVAAELTGDDHDELVVRARRQLGEVTSEVLLIYRFASSGFERALAVELARRTTAGSVHNEVAFHYGTSPSISFRPGAARGFDAESWPFVADAESDVVSVLLPWRDRETRYRFQSGAFVRD